MLDLRPVEPDDLEVYVRMRCDPQMMGELGGPQDRSEMPAKVARDVEATAADRWWTLMILPDAADRSAVAGTVTLWSEGDGEAAASEIGWMVLPEFQRRHIATAAVTAVLRRAAGDGRWGTIHAYPGVTNTASNRLCRGTGFTLVGPHDKLFRDRIFRANHWSIDPERCR